VSRYFIQDAAFYTEATALPDVILDRLVARFV
jgi:hypothetical protein